ncbi:hypothetical protein F5Y04DRAFT_57941 [Hypomontagnella monticulosa]|nr:hypothetical protein F5Y04DRAFT_57941 [Hypomontagnella monticulosa]
MATRRIISTERTILDKDDDDINAGSSTGGPGQQQSSSTAPAVPTDVILKLLAFTFAMVVIPIGSYFLTVNTIFKGMYINRRLSKKFHVCRRSCGYYGERGPSWVRHRSHERGPIRPAAGEEEGREEGIIRMRPEGTLPIAWDFLSGVLAIFIRTTL